jgi:hypothetical protein
MAGGKLTVQIGADITDFERKLKEVEFDIKELSKVKLDRLKLGLDTTEINRNIKSAKDSLSTLKATAESTGNAFSKSLSPKVANGSNALMQFSRIAQDAPYGIIGIGNNITATAESFSYLKQQTGSTGGALKALASSLMGTGGILLGVSLLTTGLTLLSQSGLSVGDVIDKITGKFDAFGESIKDASIKASESVGAEIVTLKTLVSIAQDETKSRKDRLNAADKLQELYPKILGNLSDETILTKNLSKEVGILANALISRATASEISQVAGKLQVEIYKENAALIKQKSISKDIKDETIRLVKEAQQQGSSQEYINSLLKGGKDALIDTLASENKIRNVIISKTKALERYGVVLGKITSQGDILGNIPTQPKALATQKVPKVNPNEGNVFRPFLEGNISSSLVPELALTFTDPTEGFTEWNSKVQAGLTTAEKALLDFNYAAAELINNSVANTFSDLGTVIGEALATGGNVLSAIGTTLLQSLGKFLSDMGGMLIQYGTLAVVKGKLDLAIAAGGPISIGAGLAAIAVGVALKAIGGAIGTKAKSGGSTSTSTGSDANNRSFSSGSFSSSTSSGGGTVVFEIAGQKLIGVLSNTLNANKRLGGQTTLAI